MPGVAKKSTRPPDQQQDGAEAAPKHLLRFDDPRLFAAVNAWAKENRRSRNLAILILLEQALKEGGFWPPEGPGESE